MNYIEMVNDATPSRYRKENTFVSLVERMDIIERDFRLNHQWLTGNKRHLTEDYLTNIMRRNTTCRVTM